MIRSIFAWSVLFAAAYLAALAQTSFAASIAIGPVVPALLAGVAAVWLFSRESRYDFVPLATLGLLVDLVSPRFFGLSMATFLVLGFLVTSLHRGWFWRLLPGQLLATLLFVWLAVQIEALAWMFFAAGGADTSRWPVLWLPAATALYTTALTAPIWYTLSWASEAEATELANNSAALP